MKNTAERNVTNARPAQEQQYVAPEANIYETPDGYVVQAEMPGVGKDGIEITLNGNEITIRGHRKQVQPKGQAVFRERSHADFERVFDLDPAIDTGKITARMEQGVLTLTLPKSERVRPRRISVSD